MSTSEFRAPKDPYSFVVLDRAFTNSVTETRDIDETAVRRIGPQSLDLFHAATHLISEAFQNGVQPALTDWASTGGAYFANDVTGASVAVIKPEDEEPFAVNNPKRSGDQVAGAAGGGGLTNKSSAAADNEASKQRLQHHGGARARKAGKKQRRSETDAEAWFSSEEDDFQRIMATPLASMMDTTPDAIQRFMRRGILPGEGAAREAAAYLLDHSHHAGVPPTALVLTRNPAYYVSHRCRGGGMDSMPRNPSHESTNSSSSSGLVDDPTVLKQPTCSDAMGRSNSKQTISDISNVQASPEQVPSHVEPSAQRAPPGGSHEPHQSLPSSPSSFAISSPALPAMAQQGAPPAARNSFSSAPPSSTDSQSTVLSPSLRPNVSPLVLTSSSSGLQRNRRDASCSRQPGAPSVIPQRASLPPTKVASLQLYVPHACSAEDVSSSLWPVAEVHKIAILDIRLGNTDRNDDNILVRAFYEGDPELVAYERAVKADGGQAGEPCRTPLHGDRSSNSLEGLLIDVANGDAASADESEGTGSDVRLSDYEQLKGAVEESLEKKNLSAAKSSAASMSHYMKRQRHKDQVAAVKTQRGIAGPPAGSSPTGSGSKTPGSTARSFAYGSDGAKAGQSPRDAADQKPGSGRKAKNAGGPVNPVTDAYAFTIAKIVKPTLIWYWETRLAAAVPTSELMACGGPSVCRLQRLVSRTDNFAALAASHLHHREVADVERYPQLGDTDSVAMSDTASTASRSTLSTLATPLLAALGLHTNEFVKHGQWHGPHRLIARPSIHSPITAMPGEPLANSPPGVFAGRARSLSVPTPKYVDWADAEAAVPEVGPQPGDRDNPTAGKNGAAGGIAINAPARRQVIQHGTPSPLVTHAPAPTELDKRLLGCQTVSETIQLTAYAPSEHQQRKVSSSAVETGLTASNTEPVAVFAGRYANFRENETSSASVTPKGVFQMTRVDSSTQLSPGGTTADGRVQAGLGVSSSASSVEQQSSPAAPALPAAESAPLVAASASGTVLNTLQVLKQARVPSSGTPTALTPDSPVNNSPPVGSIRSLGMRAKSPFDRPLQHSSLPTSGAAGTHVGVLSDIGTLARMSPSNVAEPSAAKPYAIMTSPVVTAPKAALPSSGTGASVPWRSTRLEALRASAAAAEVPDLRLRPTTEPSPPHMSINVNIGRGSFASQHFVSPAARQPIRPNGGQPAMASTPFESPSAGGSHLFPPVSSPTVPTYAAAVAYGGNASRHRTADQALPMESPASVTASLLSLRGRACDSTAATALADAKRLKAAKRLELIPIDHGLCLPSVHALDDISCTWVNWKQAHEPLSDADRDYVLALDGRADALMIRAILGDRVRPSCLLTLRICTALLQEGVRAGLTLSDIGLMMVRGSGVGFLDAPMDDGIFVLKRIRPKQHPGKGGNSRHPHGQAAHKRKGANGPSGRQTRRNSMDEQDVRRRAGKEELSALEQAVRKARNAVKKLSKHAVKKLQSVGHSPALGSPQLAEEPVGTASPPNPCDATPQVTTNSEIRSPVRRSSLGHNLSKLPWNLKKGQKKRSKRAGNPGQVGNVLVTPLVAASTERALENELDSASLALPSPQLAGIPEGDAATAIVPANKADVGTLSFLPYHDAVVSQFLLSIRPHIEAVLRNKSRSS